MANVGDLSVKLSLDLKGFKTGIQQATTILNTFVRTAQSAINLRLNTTQATGSINTLRSQLNTLGNPIRVNLNTSGASSRLNALTTQINDISKKAMTIGAGTAITTGGVIGKGYSEYAKTDDKMKFIETLNTDWHNLSSDEKKAYENKYKDIAKQIALKVGTDNNQVMDSMYNVLSSGIEDKNGQNNVAQFTELVAKTAKVGKVQDSGELAKNLKMMAMGFGINGDDENAMGAYQAFSDKLLTMQNLGIMNVGQAGSLGKIVNQWGRSGLDANTLFATMSGMSFYQSADQATDDINGFLRSVNNPNKRQLKYANMKGIDISAKSLQEKGLSQYLKDIKSLNLTDGELAKLFGTDEAKRFAINMMSNIDMIDKFSEQMKSSAGTTDNMWKTMESSASTQLDKLKVNMGLTWQAIGEAVQPQIDWIIAKVNELMIWFQNLGEGTKKILGTMLFWGAVAGVVVFAIGAIVFIVSSMINTVSLAVGAVTKLIGWFKGLSMASVALAGKTLLIVGALLAVAYGVWFLKNNWSSSWSAIKGYFYGIATSVVAMLGIVARAIQGVFTQLQKLDSVSPKLRELGETLGIDGLKNFDLFGDQIAGWDNQGDYYTNLANELNAKADANLEVVANTDWKLNPFSGADIQGKVQGVADQIGGNIKIPENIVNANPSNAMDMGQINDLNDQLNNYGKDSGGTGSSGSNGIADTTNKLTEGKTEAEKYADAIKTLTDKIKDMSKTFEDKIGLFDKFTYKVINSTSLLNNARKRADMYAKWQEAQNALTNRAELSESAKAEISQMGVDKVSELMALNRMSTADLSKWNTYNSAVQGISKQQAGNAVYNTTITANVNENSAKAMAEAIYKELKRKGVSI